ncbi:polysaccharide deacetylase family protein [Kineosphaera limosa]|nr:polysaccharide deacetylase family protein [Kineosphaera limosa]
MSVAVALGVALTVGAGATQLVSAGTAQAASAASATPTPGNPTPPATKAPAKSKTPATKATTKHPRPTKGGKVAYLTFDDGPDRRYTPQVLALLAKYDAKATFFMIGSQAQANRPLVARVRAHGHAIGNHTQTHPWLTKVSPATVRDQLRRADSVLGRTTCMRPPGGFVNGVVRNEARAQGKQVVLWSVDPSDWSRPGAPRITSTILSKTRPGSVILLHDGGGPRTQSVAALAQVLPRLKAQGYRFETLPACR